MWKKLNEWRAVERVYYSRVWQSSISWLLSVASWRHHPASVSLSCCCCHLHYLPDITNVSRFVLILCVICGSIYMRLMYRYRVLLYLCAIRFFGGLTRVTAVLPEWVFPVYMTWNDDFTSVFLSWKKLLLYLVIHVFVQVLSLKITITRGQSNAVNVT